MDLDKIDRLVADHVMKWVMGDEWWPYWFDLDGTKMVNIDDWHPTRSWEHTGMVIERMESKYHWVIKTPFRLGEKYWAGLTPLGVTGWNGKPDYYIEADTLTVAICLAALAAKGVDIENHE